MGKVLSGTLLEKERSDIKEDPRSRGQGRGGNQRISCFKAELRPTLKAHETAKHNLSETLP